MQIKTKLNLFHFIFISILGVLLHFTYEWSGDNPAVGLFSAVNESTWEHLKLIFFPMLLLTMIEFLWSHIQEKPLPENYLPARTIGILSGMAFIVVVFYTLNGVLGRNYEFLNIALYFAGVIYALRTENKLHYKASFVTPTNSNSNGKPTQTTVNAPLCINDYVAMTILALLSVAFFAFTKYPPALGIFADPTI